MRYFKVFPHVGLIDLQLLTNDNNFIVVDNIIG